MLEAALAGVPTVGTRVGHIADLTPQAAVAVPVADPAALADASETLARDEPRRLCLAQAAQAFAAENDAAFTARAFEQIYRELTRDR
jgi:glycosyltransferase involved in cell wall biosynthesis